VVLYDQALELWPKNEAFVAAAARARTTLAALERRASAIRLGLYAAVASIVVGLTVGNFWIQAEKSRAEAALKEQRRLSFEAVVRNATADDELGESEKIVLALEPYLAERELALHPLRAQAEALVVKARDGFKRAEAFAAQLARREATASLDLGHGLALEWVLIPAGTFTMGNSGKGFFEGLFEQSDVVAHEVTITKPFYMGKYLVTQEQYEAVTGKKPSLFKGRSKSPVETVNWYEAVAFCEKLNRQSGAAKLRLALPTEAQWEYACRAGSKTAFYFGDDEKELEQYAWFADNAGKGTVGVGTHPVGEKKPNAFGLYDMCGNVFSWCQDWYDSKYYAVSPKTDPPGPAAGELVVATNSVDRVLRGGSWDSPPKECEVFYRGYISPEDRSPGGGIRVVMTAPDAPQSGIGEVVPLPKR
jgi:formylglycine-generating enzyme required for sulfatase activity